MMSNTKSGGVRATHSSDRRRDGQRVVGRVHLDHREARGVVAEPLLGGAGLGRVEHAGGGHRRVGPGRGPDAHDVAGAASRAARSRPPRARPPRGARARRPARDRGPASRSSAVRWGPADWRACAARPSPARRSLGQHPAVGDLVLVDHAAGREPLEGRLADQPPVQLADPLDRQDGLADVVHEEARRRRARWSRSARRRAGR